MAIIEQDQNQEQGVKKTTRRTRKKSVPKVVIKEVNNSPQELNKTEQEALLRSQIAQFINEAQGKLSQLIELQRELNTSDRTRFCKLERALRRNMSYTNLERFIEQSAN